MIYGKLLETSDLERRFNSPLRPAASKQNGCDSIRLLQPLGERGLAAADGTQQIQDLGATLKATEQPIDTTTAAGKAFLDMLGVFAEFETNLRRERQLEGIAAAKAAESTRGGRRR